MSFDVFADSFGAYITGRTDVVASAPHAAAPEVFFLKAGKAENILLAVMLLSSRTNTGRGHRGRSRQENVQVIRHGFHVDECVSVSVAGFLDCQFYDVFHPAGNYLMPVFWAKHDMVIDVVDAVVRFSIRSMIIALERVFVNTFVALTGDTPFILPHKGVGFQGRVSIKRFFIADQQMMGTPRHMRYNYKEVIQHG